MQADNKHSSVIKYQIQFLFNNNQICERSLTIAFYLICKCVKPENQNQNTGVAMIEIDE